MRLPKTNRIPANKVKKGMKVTRLGGWDESVHEVLKVTKVTENGVKKVILTCEGRLKNFDFKVDATEIIYEFVPTVLNDYN